MIKDSIYQFNFMVKSKSKFVTMYGIIVNMKKKFIITKSISKTYFNLKTNYHHEINNDKEKTKVISTNCYMNLEDFEPAPQNVMSVNWPKALDDNITTNVTECFEEIIKDFELPTHNGCDLYASEVDNDSENRKKYISLRWCGNYKPWRESIKLENGQELILINCSSNPLMRINWRLMKDENVAKSIITKYDSSRLEIFTKLCKERWSDSWVINEKEFSIKSSYGTHYQV